MAQFYKILKADPLGEPWESHGKTNQTYWCQVEGEELAVSISKQVPNTLTPGQHQYGDLMKAKSQKGTDYWKFKGAQVPEGVQRPADSPAQAVAQEAVGDNIPAWALPLYNMVEYIYKEMKKMDTSADEEPEVEAKQEVKGVESLTDTPVDEETQATLDGIFGAPEEPEPEV